MARRFRIKPEDVRAIEWTPLCPGCGAIIRGLPAQGHSELCRSRVEEHLLTTGDVRLRHQTIRLEHRDDKRDEDQRQSADTDQRRKTPATATSTATSTPASSSTDPMPQPRLKRSSEEADDQRPASKTRPSTPEFRAPKAKGDQEDQSEDRPTTKAKITEQGKRTI